ncbi:hypothetical protein BBR47_57100 [Brevibacillus brevis NBRC 100599]|uniref:Glycosyltransferase n=1 Tax=Brevibacillus brevis (strain 47 / JCM 6285 / NBRC 100599) TaxID=358681 RepID=C0Z8R0_BREBN|nr:hypothetical protein [Brevibacillus brevis]BAH46687.1 hypothetical protein BBR47_57100 [Brevibacillus brevis NBRC 100599]
MSNRQPILQQYYTRGRQGVFRSNEGYDTVAKTPGLDNQFIKKTLHPFCVYDAPRQLQERAESNLSLFPEALVSFQAESGEMVLGRSVFVGADFTGQRNTFFSHNYVIPVERRDEFIKNPSKIFGVRTFADRHDDAAGKEIPTVDDIPSEKGLPQDRKQLLGQLGVDERLFKQLLFAVMSSLAAKKKVFISLDVDISASSKSAAHLLEILYSCLPYEMRRHFGFLTFSNEPQSKKHIHVTFVEKGSLRPGGGHSDKDFLFDFSLGRVQNVDLQDGGHEYLDFAWEYVNEPRVLDAFLDFCEDVLAGADHALALNLRTYYELCALYLIEKGRTSVYESKRAGVWQALNSYLGHSSLTRKKRLIELQEMLMRIEIEALSSKRLPDGETIKQIIESYRVTKQERLQMDLIRFLMDVLMKAKTARQSSYVAEVYKHLSSNRELFGFMMRTIFGYPQLVKPLFEDYMTERVSAVTSLDQMLKEIRFWSETEPQAIRNAVFIATTTEKVLRLFARERQKLAAAITIHQFFENIDGARGYADELLDELDKSLMKLVALDTLSKDDFQVLIALLEEKPQSFFGTLDMESRHKQEMLMNLAKLHEERSTQHPAEFFRKWDREAISVQQRMIQNMLSKPLHADEFPQVPLVFYREDHFGQEGFQFAELLGYVQQNGGEAVTLSFIQWTMSQRMFFEGKYLLPAYRQALKVFFLEEKGRRLRDKEWRKRWYAIRNADFRKLLDEVRSETANPLVKLFRHKAMVISSAVVLLGAGAWGGYMVWGGTSTHVQPPETQPEPTRPPAVFVPVYRLMVDEPDIQPVHGVIRERSQDASTGGPPVKTTTP